MAALGAGGRTVGAEAMQAVVLVVGQMQWAQRMRATLCLPRGKKVSMSKGMFSSIGVHEQV